MARGRRRALKTAPAPEAAPPPPIPIPLNQISQRMPDYLSKIRPPGMKPTMATPPPDRFRRNSRRRRRKKGYKSYWNLDPNTEDFQEKQRRRDLEYYERYKPKLSDPNYKPIILGPPPSLEFKVYRYMFGDSTAQIVSEVVKIMGKCESLIRFKLERVTDCSRAVYEKAQIEMRFQVILRPYSRGSIQSLGAFTSEFCHHSSIRLDKQPVSEFNCIETHVPYHRWAWKDTIDVKWLALGCMPNPGYFIVRGDYCSDYNCQSNVNVLPVETSINDVAGSHNLLSWWNLDTDHNMCEVFFAVPLPQPDDDGLCFLGYKLMFPFNSIKYILIDNSADRPDNYVYFKLKYPPQVWEALPRTFRGRRMINMRACRDWVRTLGFIPEFGYGVGISKSIFAGTTTVGIGLPKKPIRPLGVSKKFFDDPYVQKMDNPTQVLFDYVSKIRRLGRVRIFFSRVIQNRPTICLYNETPVFESFPMNYCVEALFNRGFEVMEHFKQHVPDPPPEPDEFNPKAFPRERSRIRYRYDTGEPVKEEPSRRHVPLLFQRLVERYRQNPRFCESAFESLLIAIDEGRQLTLSKAFNIFFLQRIRGNHFYEDPLFTKFEAMPENCVRVRKVIVMPTRVIFAPPEVMLSNRVLREFGEEFALRCSFRDDSGQKLVLKNFERGRMVEGSAIHGGIISDMIGTTLLHGLDIAGRTFKFLAWSNSQMRDHGCYLFSESMKTNPVTGVTTVFSIDDIRTWMGDFSMCKTVPKLMSRMGLCFTQALPTINLYWSDYTITHDVEGAPPVVLYGQDDPYCFTDGVGAVVPDMAASIAQVLSLYPIPSCFQIRYRGFKGVLAVWPSKILKCRSTTKVVFRGSQKKFEDFRRVVALEVVKYSAATPSCLNRPLVMILDQVTFIQGKNLHAVLRRKIFQYLEDEMNSLAGMLYSEEEAAFHLNQRLGVKINFQRMIECGLMLTVEPFFRSMIFAVYRVVVRQQLTKMRISLPAEDARTMYGVVDESGILQYGQVFIRYSKQAKAQPSKYDDAIVHIGRVMVTKNPCHVPGDVRIFDAIDIPALRHLHDIIVFPRYGPRPHPDEMAGSDLDGDEYTVIFQEALFFDHNEYAMQFPKMKAPDYPRKPGTVEMVNFFMMYLQQDCIGRLANGHLNMADQVGIFSEICTSIAEKCSIAVDFPKTGIPAPPFAETECNRYAPDFMQAPFKIWYRSQRLLGQLYRKSKCAEDILITLMNRGCNFGSEDHYYDSLLFIPDLSESSTNVKETLRIRDSYYSKLQQLLDEYGIDDEASLVAGHTMFIKRLTDAEKDDFSFYHAEKLVELRYTRIYKEYRSTFFEEFGVDEEDVLNVTAFTSKMQYKARLWYTVSYGPLRNKSFRSFPWVVWDVLAVTKRDTLINTRAFIVSSVNPLGLKVGRELRSFINRRQFDFNRVMGMFAAKSEHALPAVYAYFNYYGFNFAKALFIVIYTFEYHGLFTNVAFTPRHMAVLFLQYCLGILHGIPAEREEEPRIYFKKQLTEIKRRRRKRPMSVRQFGDLILNFTRYLGSFRMRQAKCINFSLGGLLQIPFLKKPPASKPMRFPNGFGSKKFRRSVRRSMNRLRRCRKRYKKDYATYLRNMAASEDTVLKILSEDEVVRIEMDSSDSSEESVDHRNYFSDSETCSSETSYYSISEESDYVDALEDAYSLPSSFHTPPDYCERGLRKYVIRSNIYESGWIDVIPERKKRRKQKRRGKKKRKLCFSSRKSFKKLRDQSVETCILRRKKRQSYLRVMWKRLQCRRRVEEKEPVKRVPKPRPEKLTMFFSKGAWSPMSDIAFRLFHYTVLVSDASAFIGCKIPEHQMAPMIPGLNPRNKLVTVAEREGIDWDW